MADVFTARSRSFCEQLSSNRFSRRSHDCARQPAHAVPGRGPELWLHAWWREVAAAPRGTFASGCECVARRVRRERRPAPAAACRRIGPGAYAGVGAHGWVLQLGIPSGAGRATARRVLRGGQALLAAREAPAHSPRGARAAR